MASEPLNRLVRATVVSLIGRREVCRSEAAFRQELLVLLLVIPVAWLLTGAGVERALLIGSWMLVIVVEMVNSAIEVGGRSHRQATP
jgi:diacylglycerol kinase (ATP)